ncbi:hypothetical protein ACJX0J_028813, partial [Zea mays]
MYIKQHYFFIFENMLSSILSIKPIGYIISQCRRHSLGPFVENEIVFIHILSLFAILCIQLRNLLCTFFVLLSWYMEFDNDFISREYSKGASSISQEGNSSLHLLLVTAIIPFTFFLFFQVSLYGMLHFHVFKQLGWKKKYGRFPTKLKSLSITSQSTVFEVTCNLPAIFRVFVGESHIGIFIKMASICNKLSLYKTGYIATI